MRNRYQGTKINPTRYDRSQIKFFAVLIPLAVVMGLPIVYIFVTAFKPTNELFAYPPRFFVRHPTLDNFAQIQMVMEESGIPMTRYLFNSLASALIVVVCTILMSISAGYVLAKKRFRIKKLLLELNTIALMFVPAAVKIPRYLIMERMHLLDSFWSNVVPLLAMPVGLFLIKQFIDQIPDALIEAARMDGAGDFIIVRRIITPIIQPAIVTVAILAFQNSWNSAVESTLYIDHDQLKAFAFYITSLTSGATTNVAAQGMAAAASLVLFVPNLIIFIVMQSKVMNTLAHSGIK